MVDDSDTRSGLQPSVQIDDRGEVVRLMLGRPPLNLIDARRAYEIGLVTRLVRAGKLETGLESYIKPLTEKSPTVLRLAHEAMRARSRGSELATTLRNIESIYLQKLLKTSDTVEGLGALIQKRTPSR